MITITSQLVKEKVLIGDSSMLPTSFQPSFIKLIDTVNYLPCRVVLFQYKEGELFLALLSLIRFDTTTNQTYKNYKTTSEFAKVTKPYMIKTRWIENEEDMTLYLQVEEKCEEELTKDLAKLNFDISWYPKSEINNALTSMDRTIMLSSNPEFGSKD